MGLAWLQTKTWHVYVGIIFPAIYAGLDAAYTLITNGTIHVNTTGLGGAFVTGLGLVLTAAASHKDDAHVNPAGVALPNAPASPDLAGQVASVRTLASEFVQLRDVLAQLPGGQQVIAQVPPEVTQALTDIRTLLQQMQPTAPTPPPPEPVPAL